MPPFAELCDSNAVHRGGSNTWAILDIEWRLAASVASFRANPAKMLEKRMLGATLQT